MSEDLPTCLRDPDSWRSLLGSAGTASRVAVEVVLRDPSGGVGLVPAETLASEEGGPIALGSSDATDLPRRVLADGETPAEGVRRICAEADHLRMVGVGCGDGSEVVLQFLADGTDQAGSLPVLAPGAENSRFATTVWAACAAWQLSGVVLGGEQPPVYPVTVEALENGTVRLGRDSDTEVPIPFGLVWADGHAVLTGDVDVAGESVVRTVAAGTAPPPGTAAYVDSQVYAGDPQTAHGLAFSEVTIDGELGPMPGWYVPPADGSSGIWTIAIHGMGASRAEALRVLPALSAAGTPVLVPAYRGDRGAPASPDGLSHLGDTEWRDVAAAVGYARGQGADGIVLYGWSMGGLMALTALDRMPEPDRTAVRGLILDCPLLDWEATLADQATRRGVPAPLAEQVRLLVTERTGVRPADLSVTGAEPGVPVLMFVDLADHTVPPEPAVKYAGARPGQVRLVTSERGHCRTWNADPARYESELQTFLQLMP